MLKAVSEKVVLVDFAATVFAMVALPKRDSLRGLVTPCSQAQETKTRMMWQNCLTIPIIICHIFHNFVLLFLIWISNGNIPNENPLLKMVPNNTRFYPKHHFFGHGFEHFAVIVIVSKYDGRRDCVAFDEYTSATNDL